ncbi:MAG: hypothetical protein R2698_07755 [Microthrixaceae bacterium]
MTVAARLAPMVIALDEFPIHQTPLSMAHPATGDRNFYDRCYLNAHDRTGEVFLVTGLGIYPNLGVIDAYATVRVGDLQHTVRISDALTDDRMEQRVGPYRIEVVEPLRRLHLVCDAEDHGIGFDLHWTGAFPVVQEQPHVLRVGGRVILDASRFAQTGRWSGTLRVHGQTFEVDPATWEGTRDRSWGIRPVGEPEPPGRQAAESPADYGFWWTYLPLRFDDFAVVIIAQEDGRGHRTLNDAVRVWPAESGRDVELLGWPEFRYRYRPGSRDALGATVVCCAGDGTPITIVVESLGNVALNCGPGYGGDPDWTHGQWRGRNFVEGATLDMTDPAVLGRIPFGVVDHVGRAVLSEGGVDRVGYGLFEHACIGAHLPSGFTGFASVSD